MFQPRAVITGDREVLQKLKNVAKSFKERSEVAVYKTMRESPRTAAKEIQEELGRSITQTSIKEKIEKRKIKQGSHLLLIYRSDRLQLPKFAGRQVRAGVSYKMRGERQLADKAFMGNYKQKSTPAKLKGGAWKRIGRHRAAPIVQLFGPSPWGVLNPRMSREPRLENLKNTIRERFHYMLEREINYQISKLNQG